MVTFWPAARMMSPPSVCRMPLFSIFGAMRMISPRLLMVPSFLMPFLWLPSKLNFPARKLASEMLSVEAMKPAVSMRAPCPKTIPLGLIRKTRPFELSCPRILLASPPTTRLRMALAAFCCWMRTLSPAPMLNCCQLMMAPGVFWMLRVLAFGLVTVAWPAATCAPFGSAKAGAERTGAKRLAIASEISDGVSAFGSLSEWPIRIIVLSSPACRPDQKRTVSMACPCQSPTPCSGPFR